MAPQVFYGSERYPSTGPQPVVTIGNFDGVHLGHRQLLGPVVERAGALGVPACAYTFEPPPQRVLNPDRCPPRILSLAEKIVRLGEVGIDHVVVERFDRDFARRPPEWFIYEVLERRLRAQVVYVGHDFRFGQSRAGDFSSLRDGLTDVEVLRIEAFQVDAMVASSSRIRERVAEGRVGDAARILGRPYAVDGRVVRGDGRGRGLGFPTANLETDAELLPANGVYAVEAAFGDAVCGGVANLGVRPTFEGRRFALEVHLMDFEGDLYEQPLQVRFLQWIRGERRFDSRDALIAQIRADVEAARAIVDGRDEAR